MFLGDKYNKGKECGFLVNVFGGGMACMGHAQGVSAGGEGLEQVRARAGDCGRRVRQVQ